MKVLVICMLVYSLIIYDADVTCMSVFRPSSGSCLFVFVWIMVFHCLDIYFQIFPTQG